MCRPSRVFKRLALQGGVCLPFGRRWYGAMKALVLILTVLEADAVSDAIGYAQLRR